jgi:hypothetical protein
MKHNGDDWMDWLHRKRAEEEAKRLRDGISGAEWLRRVSARAQEILASLPEHEPATVARDKPTSGSRP